MGKRDDVYGNIGRENFEKICKQEEQKPIKKTRIKNPILDDPCQSWCSTHDDEVKPLYIDPCELTQPPQEFTETKWISKEEALKIWPDRTDSVLDCTNEKCLCKARKKENEGLKRKEMGNDDLR